MDDKAILAACFFKNVDEPISTFRDTEDGMTVVTATGDEMQMLCTVVAMELSRHGVRLEGMRSLDCDHALRRFVTKSPPIAKNAMSVAPATERDKMELAGLLIPLESPGHERRPGASALSRGDDRTLELFNFRRGLKVPALRFAIGRATRLSPVRYNLPVPDTKPFRLTESVKAAG